MELKIKQVECFVVSHAKKIREREKLSRIPCQVKTFKLTHTHTQVTPAEALTIQPFKFAP